MCIQEDYPDVIKRKSALSATNYLYNEKKLRCIYLRKDSHSGVNLERDGLRQFLHHFIGGDG